MQLKPPLSFDDQLEKLLSRGMVVKDSLKALEFLRSHNYYHLNKYFHEFMDTTGNFRDGITFETIETIYENDAWLRNHLFSLIEPFELKIKTIIANHLSLKYGSDAFYRFDIYENVNAWQNTINTVLRDVKRDSSHPVVAWHMEHYNGLFPMWVLIEFFTLGSTSRFFGNLRNTDKNEIADNFNISGYLLASWLKSISLLRNFCAHNGQLFRRIYTSAPFLPSFFNWPSNENRSLFSISLILKRLSTREDWQLLVNGLIHRELIQPFLGDYGFPQDWRSYLNNQ